MTAAKLLTRYQAGELVFKGTDLRRICLYGADLHYANLAGSNRQNWSTQGANLWSVFS